MHNDVCVGILGDKCLCNTCTRDKNICCIEQRENPGYQFGFYGICTGTTKCPFYKKERAN